MPGPRSVELLVTARSLAVDLITAEIVTALRDRAIDSVLLKGPTIATWLYGDGAARPYYDTDLLVAPADCGPAQEALRALGFRYAGVAESPTPALPGGLGWFRGDDEVDLHTSLVGVGVDAATAWRVLASATQGDRVGGAPVRVLGPPARALHVALHAAQHGIGWPQPLEDLARAIEQLPRGTWEAAALLARRLEATGAFARGIALDPRGHDLAHGLGVQADASVEGRLRAESASPLALGLERLRRTPGTRRKAAMLAREAFPSPDFIRIWSPVGRRGRLGLGLAYAWRLAWLVANAAPATVVWLRARRDARR